MSVITIIRNAESSRVNFSAGDMHVHCHNMESEYCDEVDNEFSWDEITDYIQDKYCRDCEHSPLNDQLENWEECDYYITNCPKLIKLFSDMED